MKTIVTLEGGKGGYSDMIELFGNEYNVIHLDNLYEDFGKLAAIKFIKPDYIYTRTTGVYVDEINRLISLFDSLEYVPTNVIFGSERSAMMLLGTARELKEKGTKFFYYFEDEKEFEEIEWI